MTEPPVPSGEHERPSVGIGTVVLKRTGAGPEVLLIRRGKPPRMGEWSIPGGRQEWGETIRETAVREVQEETGITAINLRLIDVVDGITRSAGAVTGHWTLVDFRADWGGGEPQAGDDATDAKWVPVSALPTYGLWSETQRIIDAALALD
ncbi:MAG: NUDIX hydrolase [Rhodospirillaceae bacterium]